MLLLREAMKKDIDLFLSDSKIFRILPIKFLFFRAEFGKLKRFFLWDGWERISAPTGAWFRSMNFFKIDLK